jgi:hypothetical protein
MVFLSPAIDKFYEIIQDYCLYLAASEKSEGTYMSTLRPMTINERQALITKARNPITLNSVLLVVVFLSTLSIGIIFLVSRFLSFYQPYYPLLFSSIIIVWLAYSIRSYIKLRVGFSLTLYKDDLASGLVEVAHLRATDAISVRGADNESSVYFLHLEDGRTLFLEGGYLGDLEKVKKFPCSEFDVVRGHKSGAILDLICNGSYFPSQKTITLREQPVLQEFLTDGSIVAIPWEKINKFPSSA